MPSHRTTGLRPAQFTTLLALLTNTLTWNTPNTKPHKLTLTQGLKATLLYLRQNQTEEFLAEDFGVSQPTISRILNKIETALLHVLAPVVPPIPETLLQSSGTVIVDGTLVPTYNWHGPGMRLYSGKTPLCWIQPPDYLHSRWCTLGDHRPRTRGTPRHVCVLVARIGQILRPARYSGR